MDQDVRDDMRLSVLNAAQRQFFEDEGYLILSGFFAPSDVAALRAHIDTLWAERARPDNPVTIDGAVDRDGRRVVQRTYFRDVDDETRRHTYKLNDLHLLDEPVARFAMDARLVAVMGTLLAAAPIVCNTLLFERGSQQKLHFDTFYMPSRTPGKMAASWIALDPVTESNGPLVYYPRSHLIPPYRFSNGGVASIAMEMPAAEAHIARIIDEHGLRAARFLPQPGDLLIWHGQLLHGGGTIADMTQTRASLVTHYWTDVDFPDPAMRIDIGHGQYMLNKGHQLVVGKATRREIDSLLQSLTITDAERAAVPAGFDPAAYLLRNLDLLAARCNPYDHYIRFGRAEGRVW